MAQALPVDVAKLSQEERVALAAALGINPLIEQPAPVAQTDKAPAKAEALKAPKKHPTHWFRTIEEARSAMTVLAKRGMACEFACRFRPGYPNGQQYTYSVKALY